LLFLPDYSYFRFKFDAESIADRFPDQFDEGEGVLCGAAAEVDEVVGVDGGDF
jgi:hypothetical protein